MSDEHKGALAEGRQQGRIVRSYLEALDSHKPKRGRKRTSDSITRRLEELESQMATSDPLRRLQLTQERMQLQDELTGMGSDGGDVEELEAQFVTVAAAYATRKGISYQAFREVGVPVSVLKAAGIRRGGIELG